MGVIHSNPKSKTYRSRKYLKWLRGQKCGMDWCGQDGEPHHVRKIRWGAGVSQKPHDFVTVSRCRVHHDAKYDRGAEMEIIDSLMKYIEETK